MLVLWFAESSSFGNIYIYYDSGDHIILSDGLTRFQGLFTRFYINLLFILAYPSPYMRDKIINRATYGTKNPNSFIGKTNIKIFNYIIFQ